MSDTRIIRVGSRKSQLALIQTSMIIENLRKVHPHLKFETITMTTMGDRILDSALSKIGEKSLFTKELEHALKDKKVDFVVHSLKDLPTALPDGLVIGCVFKRDNPHDGVVMHPWKHRGKTLKDLPSGSVIGTSSLRRAAQLKRRYPELKIENLRGNLNTRFKKLMDGEMYDAIVLAVAGLERMDWHERISEVLQPSDCMYAVSQGAMAVECREDDHEMIALLSGIHHPDTALRCVAERAYLKRLEGGCSVPVAVHTEVKNKQLYIKGGVFSNDGKEAVEDELTMDIDDDDEFMSRSSKRARTETRHYAGIVGGCGYSEEMFASAEDLGCKLADQMLKNGADKILSVAKEQARQAIMEERAKLEAKKKAEAAASNSASGDAAQEKVAEESVRDQAAN